MLTPAWIPAAKYQIIGLLSFLNRYFSIVIPIGAASRMTYIVVMLGGITNILSSSLQHDCTTLVVLRSAVIRKTQFWPNALSKKRLLEKPQTVSLL